MISPASAHQATRQFVRTLCSRTFRPSALHRSLPAHRRGTRLTATAPQITGSGTSLYPHGLQTVQGVKMQDVISRLGTSFEEVELKQSGFVRPTSVMYDLDGKRRRWDVIESHASVGIVIYHKTLNAFLVVRQFRPAVYMSAVRTAKAQALPTPPTSDGFTIELCAGILDKSKSLEEISREEIAEECGFLVPVERIHRLTTAISSTGISGAVNHMFYVEVDDSMRADDGGGLVDHGELIEVLALPVDATEAFCLDMGLPKSPGAMFGLMWALHHIRSNGNDAMKTGLGIK